MTKESVKAGMSYLFATTATSAPPLCYIDVAVESGMTLMGSVTFLVLSWVLKKKLSLCLNRMCNANMQSMPFHIIYLLLLTKIK